MTELMQLRKEGVKEESAQFPKLLVSEIIYKAQGSLDVNTGYKYSFLKTFITSNFLKKKKNRNSESFADFFQISMKYIQQIVA